MSKFHNTTQWRKLRTLKLAKDPLCQLCLMKGIERAASEVHHLLNVIDYLEDATDSMYLQSLCAECHDQITGRERPYGRRAV